MKRKQLPMSIEEFEMIEHPFGYKVEYWDGEAVFTPREYNVTTQLAITRRPAQPAYPVVPIDPTAKTPMIAAFFEAFKDSVEFCDWSEDDIRAHAEKNINQYFDGIRGKPHPASVMALAPDGQTLAGLALLVHGRDGHIHLDLLLVMPTHQRKRLATDMVAVAVNQLFTEDVQELYSSYHICNVGSQKWHHSFGFQAIYDPFYVRLKYAWCRHEIGRHEKLGLHDKANELAKEKDFWHNQLEKQP